eukprot:jgi/Mesvir1/26369/Mv23099-RA.1
METCKVCPRPVLPAEDLCEACMERMDHVVAQGHAQYFLDAAEQCRMHPYAAADVLKVYLTRTCNYWMDLVHFTAHVLYAENTRAVVEIVQRYHDRKRYLRAVDALLTSGGDSECRLSKSWHGVLSSPVHARIQANRSAVKEGETGERPRRVKSLTTLCYLQLPSADLAWLRAAGAEGGWTWTPSLDGGGGGRLGLLGGWRPYRRKLAEGGHLPLFSRELVPRNLFFPQLLPLFLTIFRLLLAPLFSRDSFLFLRPGHSVSGFLHLPLLEKDVLVAKKLVHVDSGPDFERHPRLDSILDSHDSRNLGGLVKELAQDHVSLQDIPGLRVGMLPIPTISYEPVDAPIRNGAA